MVADITWDSMVVWLCFAIALFFLLRPMVPVLRKKKKAKGHSDCSKCD